MQLWIVLFNDFELQICVFCCFTLPLLLGSGNRMQFTAVKNVTVMQKSKVHPEHYKEHLIQNCGQRALLRDTSIEVDMRKKGLPLHVPVRAKFTPKMFQLMWKVTSTNVRSPERHLAFEQSAD